MNGWITIARCLDRSTVARFILGSCEDEKKGSIRTSNSLSPLPFISAPFSPSPSPASQHGYVSFLFTLPSSRQRLLSSDRRCCISSWASYGCKCNNDTQPDSRCCYRSGNLARYTRTVEAEFCTTLINGSLVQSMLERTEETWK